MKKRGIRIPFLLIISIFIMSLISVSASQFGYNYLNNYLQKGGDNTDGIYNFNGGWMDGGLTIEEGDIYAQTGYFYNLTSLNISKQNLTITDSLLVDNPTFFIDSVNNRVGIGTTSPLYPLDNVGTTYLRSTTYMGEGATIGSYNGNNGRLKFSDTSGLSILNSGGTFLNFTTDGSQRLGTTQYFLLNYSRNYDLGEGSMLQIYGYVPSLSLYDISGGSYDVSMFLNGNKFLIRNETGSYSFTDAILSADLTSGKVGIGTTTPQNTLNVLGAGNFTTTLSVGLPAVPTNITLYSANSTAYSCGVLDGGAFVCTG